MKRFTQLSIASETPHLPRNTDRHDSFNVLKDFDEFLFRYFEYLLVAL